MFGRGGEHHRWNGVDSDGIGNDGSGTGIRNGSNRIHYGFNSIPIVTDGMIDAPNP